RAPPLNTRWRAAWPWRKPLNAGSTVMTSGSVKYVVGAPPGPKSRGGGVMVLAGSAGLPAGGAWAEARAGASATAPAVAPMAVSRERRVRRVRSSMGRPPRKLLGTVADAP